MPRSRFAPSGMLFMPLTGQGFQSQTGLPGQVVQALLRQANDLGQLTKHHVRGGISRAELVAVGVRNGVLYSLTILDEI
jgi:hypothetical protein